MTLLPSDRKAAAFFFFSSRGDSDSEGELESLSSLVLHDDQVFSSAEEASEYELSDHENDTPATAKFLLRPKYGREYFYKTTDDREAASKIKAKPIKPKREDRKPTEKTTITPSTRKEEDLILTRGDITKKLTEILTLRGRKSIDRREQVDALKELADVAKKLKLPSLEAHLKLQVASAIFDIMVGQATIAMPRDLWGEALTMLNEALTLADENPVIVLDSKLVDTAPTEDVAFSMHLSLSPFVTKLEYELTKALQLVDYRDAEEYQQRVDDELEFLKLAERAQDYYHRNELYSHCIHLALRQLEHVFFRTDDEHSHLLMFPQF
ncbi:hypothetical protein GEMRC1_003746 [Eukaryota sp. GEM-RC1]